METQSAVLLCLDPPSPPLCGGICPTGDENGNEARVYNSPLKKPDTKGFEPRQTYHIVNENGPWRDLERGEERVNSARQRLGRRGEERRGGEEERDRAVTRHERGRRGGQGTWTEWAPSWRDPKWSGGG